MSKKAFEHCEKITRDHYENFPVASRLVPKKFRPYICSVYAFARTADDFADEAEYNGSRMEKLLEWQSHLVDLTKGEQTHPVFVALGETIRRFNIPLSYFQDLLTAFKMDVTTSRYRTFDDLLHYCRHSANPVGRIILHIIGYANPPLLEYSDAICTALQLANFWQDVTIDLAKGRIYIPQEDLDRFHVPEQNLVCKKYNDDFARLMQFEVERTEALFQRGKPLVQTLRGRFGLELRATWLGGMTILKKISAAKGDVFSHRPTIRKKDVPKILFGAIRGRLH